MSALIIPLPPPAETGIEEAQHPRAFLGCLMTMASIHLGHAADHLAMSDGPALERSMRKAAACLRAMLDTLPDALRQIEHEESAR